jgi:4-hydroxybenzoate polyprenyltransferase
MKEIVSFFKLIRWPNLVFIAVTQILFRYFILHFVYRDPHVDYEKIKLSETLFLLLVLASVCIAAAGYIINDYFDVNIDQVNKSSKVFIGKIISRRWAIFFHATLSIAGLILSFIIGYQLHNFYVPLFNFFAILLLWFYSTTFKKKLLIGNIIISLLSAWVILVLALAEYRFRISSEDIVWHQMLVLTFFYAGFAFVISLIREVIKDMEDIEGDSNFGCKTMPIVWGLPASKVFVAVWLIVLTATLLILQIFVVQFGWWLLALYSISTLIVPLLFVLKKLYVAKTKNDFHKLSSMVKMIMAAGILSMIFFYRF